MASKYAIERARGQKESRRQLVALREKWPVAFPAGNQDVRPLSIGAAGEISMAMGWQLPYALGVLSIWKMAPAYCQAVLRYDQRIGLDGSPAEPVDVNSRDLAAKRLAELAARKTAKAAQRTVAPAAAKKPVSAPPLETPEQLRARVRASLLRRSA
jgi:sRNA-binding protein